MYKNRTIASAVKYALLASSASGLMAFNAFAAESDSNEEAEEDNRVVVTGSRLKKNQAETAQPVTIIEVEELEQRGFTNVFDALKGLTQSTGAIVGEQNANSAGGTAGQAVNIRGFGPGRTLALINGRRVTDNPTSSYTGGSYFNWAIIPIAAVERIEVLTGGASAIYGSDAVTGVINVILKNDLDEIMAGVRYGETPEGGGESVRFQLIGGDVSSDHSLTYVIEYQDQNAIQGKDRKHLDSAFDNPNFPDAPVSYNLNSWLLEYSTFTFVNPTDEQCATQDAFSSPYPFNPGLGDVCVDDNVGEFTIRNPRKRSSAIVNYTYNLDLDTQFFARGLYWDSETNNQIFRKFVQGIVQDPVSGAFYNYLRSFDPQTEVAPSSFTEQQTFVLASGLKGVMGEYEYETGINFSRSTQDDRTRQFRQSALQEIAELTDFNPWNPLDMSQLSDDSIGFRTSDAVSKSLGIDFSISGELFDLPAGPVAFAAIAEYQRTEYEIVVDAIAREGQDVNGGWSNGSADFGAGDRERYALGFEFSIPLMEGLELGLATRYDDYHDGSSVGGRLSSQANIAYRPLDSLLIRGSYAESFRAPDMHYLFRERQDAFLSGVVDVAECRYADETGADAGAFPNCLGYAQTGSVRYLGEGNPELEEETGENYGLGLVYDITDDLSFTIDYFKVTLDNQVSVQSSTTLLVNEANCRLGTNRAGTQTFDPNSDECQEAFRVVEREDAVDANGDGIITPDELGDITRVRPSYINVSSLTQSGVDMTINYDLQTESAGDFTFQLGTTNVNTYDFMLDDTERDIKDSIQEPKERINFTASWSYDDFSTTLFVTKIGSVLNDQCFNGINADGVEFYDPAATDCNEDAADGTGVVKRGDSMITANLNLAYRLTEDLDVIMQIVNVTDDKGPQDKTLSTSAAQSSGWPWVNPTVYPLTGREVFLEARYTF
ncbi:TonB-dependent receptor plug domain-containing protein [Pleionea sediminis]|uniref:TonB-dependent receptor plug domain-containing protein n=1 Tax=Pleionea sediminis TaxID=2569479 RepID=UPI001184C9AD|nr:TonB-dependent receptor [Pleionea sediminis]